MKPVARCERRNSSATHTTGTRHDQRQARACGPDGGPAGRPPEHTGSSRSPAPTQVAYMRGRRRASIAARARRRPGRRPRRRRRRASAGPAPRTRVSSGTRATQASQPQFSGEVAGEEQAAGQQRGRRGEAGERTGVTGRRGDGVTGRPARRRIRLYVLQVPRSSLRRRGASASRFLDPGASAPRRHILPQHRDLPAASMIAGREDDEGVRLRQPAQVRRADTTAPAALASRLRPLQPRRVVRRPVGAVGEVLCQRRRDQERPRHRRGRARRRSAGRTNNSKQTRALTGLPGRPKTSVGGRACRRRPACPASSPPCGSAASRRPLAARPAPGRACPAETPPESSSTSARSPSAISGRRLSSRSRAMPR